MFIKGEKSVTHQLGDIRDALIAKDGIVEGDQVEVLREQLRSSFSNALIKALAASTKSSGVDSLKSQESFDKFFVEAEEDDKQEREGDDAASEATSNISAEEEEEAATDQEMVNREYIK
jgi:hypothetical protein